MDLRQIKVDEDEFGLMSYDRPSQHRSCRSAITYIDGDAGSSNIGLLDRAALRALLLPRGRLLLIFGELPTKAQFERWTFDITHHTYVHEDLKHSSRASATTPTDGDAALGSGRSRPSIRTPSARRPRRALHGRGPPDRQGADSGRLLLPPQHGFPYAYRTTTQLLRELPLDDVQETKPTTSRRKLCRRRWTCSSSSTPTTNRTARPTPCAASAPPTWTPTRRSPPGRGALRPAARRRQRAVLRMLRRIESADNISDFSPSEGARGETDGLRPPRLQELRPAGADHPAAHGRGLRCNRVQPAGRDRRELEKRALDDEYFTSRKLYPNVDFYSGIIYEASRSD